ncbi:uncharacterized protein LOC124134263 [Haliotis rufescens]|uniref:uncharacterized protein LOC124134263 n=1 Tax=Haliotis rufescens TaxID=6454 RepID=UPI00201EDC52|nr:uncharacterized protein LOC124134263 [Haliotis rufescens]
MTPLQQTILGITCAFVLPSLLLPEVRAQSLFVRISDADRAFTSGNVLRTLATSSAVECGVECGRLDTCVSFNSRLEGDATVTCDLLSDIPLSPMKNLAAAAGTGYYEQTCQPLFSLTTAVEFDEGGVNVAGFVYVTSNHGVDVMLVNMSTTNDVLAVSRVASVAQKSGGKFTQIHGMTKVHMGNGTSIEVFMTGSDVWCTLEGYGLPSQPCFASNPMPMITIFGTDGISALLETKTHVGMMAFSYSKVIIMDILSPGNWVVNTTIDLSPGNQPPGWMDIPRGLVGSAWLVRQDSTGLDIYDTAFLVTQHYYVVYDFPNDVILKRGHLCPSD